ncbi:MAG TPA: sugar-binding protein [Polyangiaceae bacterium]
MTLLGAMRASASEGSMLPAVLADDVKIRLDGLPKEFPGTWNALDKLLAGKSTKKLASFAQGAIAYDDTNLYVAMRLEDDKIVRTATASSNEDHATLSLAFPLKARTYRTYQVELYPGLPGKFAGVVKIGDSKVSGAELVEAPDGDGFTFEAKIPWSAFAEANRIRVGLRAALRYADYVAEGRSGVVVATSPAREGAALPALLTESEYPLIAGMLRDKGVSAEPAREAFGNVGGDSTWERVALFDKYLVVLGSRFRQGKEFVVTELSVSRAQAVQRLELTDFDGDGASEILVVYRVGSSDEYREVLQVLKVKPDESLSSPFVHEVGMKSTAGELHNEVHVVHRGGKNQIEIAQGEASGYEKDSYAEAKPSDMEATLLPWDDIKDKTYAWDTTDFKKTAETKQSPKPSGKSSGGKLAKATSGVARRRDAGAGNGEALARSGPPAPRAPSADEMQDQIYALYRKDRGVKSQAPRFDFVTDVAASSANERVLVHDRDIVCFGKAFRDGASYVFTSIGVASAEDIIDMTASDLTGDGKAEILVRAVMHAQSGPEPDAKADNKLDKKRGKKADKKSEKPSNETKAVDRLVFIVFQIREDGIKRIFAAETGRGVSGSWMLGGLRLLEGPRGLQIELLSGHAHGFTKSNYPFNEDSSMAGGFEPLALPWGNLGSRRYRFDGSKYTLQ